MEVMEVFLIYEEMVANGRDGIGDADGSRGGGSSWRLRR